MDPKVREDVAHLTLRLGVLVRQQNLVENWREISPNLRSLLDGSAAEVRGQSEVGWLAYRFWDCGRFPWLFYLPGGRILTAISTP